jgi:cytochrome c553
MNMKLLGNRIELPSLNGLLLGAALTCAAAPGLAQEKPVAALIGTCIDCHGNDGIGLEPDMPHLNGQPEIFLVNMLNDFRQGKRQPKVRIHREIPEADVAPLARHYAQQKAVRPKSATNPELVTRGEALYLKHCSDCHVDNGRDSDKEAPLVAGQSLQYLLAQMVAFNTGERKFPYLMDGAYKGLSDQALIEIAHFFAAQEQLASQTGRKRRR